MPIEIKSPPNSLQKEALANPTSNNTKRGCIIGAETISLYFSVSSSNERRLSTASQLNALNSELCSKLIGCAGMSITSLQASLVCLSIIVRMMFL